MRQLKLADFAFQRFFAFFSGFLAGGNGRFDPFAIGFDFRLAERRKLEIRLEPRHARFEAAQGFLKFGGNCLARFIELIHRASLLFNSFLLEIFIIPSIEM